MTRYRHGFWFVLVAFLLGGVLTTEVRAQSVIDLCDLVQRGNQINVDIVSVRSNRRTGQVTMGLRLANVSGESVPPPIYLAIQNITSQDATVDNASGVDVSGIPFFVVGQELTEIPPGDTVDVSVIFGNVGRSRFTFDAMAFGVAESFFVTMTDPLSQTLTNQTDIPVSGNISSSATEVSVNGVPGVILGDTWSIGAVPLTHEGTNSLSALAINSDGAVANVATTVTRDTTPPTVTFTSPLAGATVYVESIAVTGAYNDPVAGLLSNEEPTATINGIPASSSNGAFLASAVPLVMGLNTLAATVTDQAGNARTVTRDVIYDPAAVRKIVVVSGDNQAAPISEQLAQPLVAQLLDEAGQPVGGETVFFRVRQSNGVFGDLSRLASAESDVDGFAQIDFVVGSRTGVGCNRVEATAVDFVGPAIFVSTSTGGTADKINAATGERQVAAVDTQAPQAMCVLVTDIGNNPLSGIKVIFEVTDGGGHFLENGTATLGATTDVTGRTQATFVTGPLAGIDINMVSARIEEGEGSDASPVIFTVTGVNAGDPDETTFSGVVIDHTETPMPGVMITIGEESTTTDPEGQFSLSNIPVGPIHLVANGSTTSVPGEWPTLAYEHTTVAGIDNTLGMPIRLLPIDQDFPIAGGDEAVELTMVEVPGFKLKVFPNSVTMPDGSPTGLVSVTQVRTDTIPMAPGDGMQPNFIITVQPPGAHFDPPAQVTYPNTDGLGAGAMTNLYSFDHDLGRFVMIGPGTVSEDATVITSAEGFGIVKGGWHCAGPSVPQGHAQPVLCKINGKANPDPVCLGLNETKTLTATGTPQPPKDPAKPYQWSIPGSLMLVNGTLNSSSITVKAIVADPSGNITCAYTCESGATDTATAKLGACDFFLEKSLRTLCEKNNMEVKVDPGKVVTAYKIQIRRTTDPGWLTLGSTQKLPNFVQRIAGKFKLRGCATINGTECYSDEKDLEVRFPSYAKIVADAFVISSSDASWASIKAYALSFSTTTKVRREEGFWYRFNTTTCKYEKTATVQGADRLPAQGASVDIGLRPADSPAMPAANAAGATYSVCSFHTHTPTAFRTVGRAVGPSGADQNIDSTIDKVPGIVYDYVGDSAGNAPAGHPLNSAAKRYMSGLTRRPTP